jgi:hypothetical protein
MTDRSGRVNAEFGKIRPGALEDARPPVFGAFLPVLNILFWNIDHQQDAAMRDVTFEGRQVLLVRIF